MKDSGRTKRVWVRRLSLLALVLGSLGGALAGWLYHWKVIAEPGPELSRAAIRAVIAQESPVFHRDGVTRVGVFFEDEHRNYVGWEDLPRAYVASIVAAEDDAFWSHPGFDGGHILRAVWDNLSAGRLVAGGSTLTQQTAKNLYYRPDRSLRSKLVEALNALRLEAHYDKSEILTFYANQFHVSGNGRGIGIAARHFFDKDVSQLGLVECAFLAGMVKGPTSYDPFLGDQARRERAISRATARTAYVLRRLVAEPASRLAGPYPDRGDVGQAAAYDRRIAEVRRLQAEARSLLDDGFTIPFARGVFRYDSNAVLDEVARRLGQPPFAEVLAAAGIDDPGTAGLQVITTLDVEAQRAAVYGLWHHLTDVGVVLEQLGPDAFVRQDVAGPRYDPDHVPVVGDFRVGRILEIVEDEGRKHALVDLGGSRCTVDRAAMVRAAVAVHRGAMGSLSAKTSTEEVNAFVDALGEGAVVWVSVRSVGPKDVVCDLEVRPELQGAAVVLRDGEVLAMVGGNDNRNFNRATAARQMGSTWKPLVLHAAMELGWRPDDVLDNRRAMFPFSKTYYWPRPDHASTEEVSLAWAGVRSENLASIWLLFHLTDRLEPEALAELAEALGLARGPDESRAAYALRMQQAGIAPGAGSVREGLFYRARQEVLARVRSLRHPEDEVHLLSLLYGAGMENERRKVSEGWQLAALDHQWLGVEARWRDCLRAWERAVPMLELGLGPPVEEEPSLWFRRGDDGLDVACGHAPEGYEPWRPGLLRGSDPHGLDMTVPPEPGAVTADSDGAVDELVEVPSDVALPQAEDLSLDGRLHLSTVEEVAAALERRELQQGLLEEPVDPYDAENLYWHQDFRVLLNMRYVARLARLYGVRSDIEEVLSMPLGASEITLEEAVAVYEGLVTGRAWTFPGQGPSGSFPGLPDSVLLISEIRDVDGGVLYKATPRAHQVGDGDVAAMTLDVLEHVITQGTGRAADGAVSIAGAPLPLAGKTGTTNSFRNAAFLGAVPQLAGNALGGPIILGVYVGYDDNRPMVRGNVKLSGSSGALPAWVGVARGLALGGVLAPDEVSVPLGGWKRIDPLDLVRLPVDPVAGGLPSAEGTVSLLTRPQPEVARGYDEIANLALPAAAARVAPRTEDFERQPRSGDRATSEPSGLWQHWRDQAEANRPE